MPLGNLHLEMGPANALRATASGQAGPKEVP
jgi:hypothetical protein